MCKTHSVPFAVSSHVNLDAWSAATIAPPLDSNALMVDVSLVLGEHESINLITGHTITDGNCTGVFTYTICTLESAIGLYDIVIEGNEINMQDVPAPTLVALANNTAVNHTEFASANAYPSTLGGIVALMFERWDAYVFFYRQSGTSVVQALTSGAPVTQFDVPRSNRGCSSWTNPRDSVTKSINQLMLYIGAAAASMPESYLAANMDPGLPIQRTVTGYRQGDHNVFQTTYWYFLGMSHCHTEEKNQ